MEIFKWDFLMTLIEISKRSWAVSNNLMCFSWSETSSDPELCHWVSTKGIRNNLAHEAPCKSWNYCAEDSCETLIKKSTQLNAESNKDLTLLITYLLTYLRSWALLQKLPIVQPLKNVPGFYGTRKFITVFTRALHWSLSWARLIQSIQSHPSSLRSILILSTHLRLGFPSDLSHSGFPTNILYGFFFSRIRATCPAHLIPGL
jgi:hypothetical protein